MSQVIRQTFITTLSVLFIAINLSAKTGTTEKDYLGIKEIRFYDRSYKLAWSSHPSLQYYKQEYLTDGEKIERFNNLILIDFFETDKPLEDAVDTQVNMLKIRKHSDAVCNYQIRKKNGEYILDFLISEGNEYNLKLLEWNAYHYKGYVDKAGNKGILMFGYSHRAYNADAEQFISYFAEYRSKFMTTLSTYPVPEIQLKLYKKER